MRIAIMGSGGVGAYVGAWLQRAGAEVNFIARGAHLAALREDGLRIEHPQQPLHLLQVSATDDPGAIGPVDLVIFCVKLFDTHTAARGMAPLIGPRTRVLTLQNGIDSVEMIRRQLDATATVLAGVIYVSAFIERPGVIRAPGGMHLIVADRAADDETMAALARTTRDIPGLDVSLTDEPVRIKWEKFVILSAFSGATSLLRARAGAILGSPEASAFLRQLVDEVVAVGSAQGVSLRSELADEVMAKIAAMPASFRSSMAEDLERGNRLEVEWLSGRVHSLGQELGVQTPAHTAVYRGLVLHKNGVIAG